MLSNEEKYQSYGRFRAAFNQFSVEQLKFTLQPLRKIQERLILKDMTH